MLESIRNFTQGITFKILITLIIASFVFWGIGGVFTSNLAPFAAKIGKNKIYESNVQNKIQQTKKNIATEGINETLLRQLVLQNIIRDELILVEKQELGFFINNKTAFQTIKSIPLFLDESEKFDNQKFANFLQSKNLSEQDIFRQIKNDISDNLINNNFTTEGLDFKKLQQLQQDFENETKHIAVIKISIPKKISTLKNPSESELVDFHKKNKEMFKSPESRDISLIDLNCKNFTKSIKFSETEIKKEYQSSEKYNIPEKREIHQIFSKTAEGINIAYENLEKGSSFTTAAKSLEMEDKDINLGLQSKSSIFAAFKSVFDLKRNQYSKPIKGPFGYHIFKSTKIIQAKTIPYQKAKQEIKASLTESKACETAFNISNKIQDEVSAGLTIKEIAEKHSLKLFNKNTSKEKITNIASLTSKNIEKLSLPLFKQNNLNKIRKISLNSKHNIFYKLNSIIEARFLTIDEVRGSIIKEWQKAEHKKKHRKIAEKIHNKLNSSTKPNRLAQSQQKLYYFDYNRYSITRNDFKNLPIEIGNNIFSLKKDQLVTDIIDEGNSFYIAIFKSKNIKNLSEGEAILQSKQLQASYLEHFNNSLLNSYLAYLSKKHNVLISNQKSEQ